VVLCFIYTKKRHWGSYTMATGVLARLQLAYSKMATSELAPQGPKPSVMN
jgi:hypothetical protein